MNRYKAGTPVKVTYTLTPSADATEFTVKYALQEDGQTGLGTPTTLTLGNGVVRDAQGVYHVLIDTTGSKSGMIVHQALASGTAQGAASGEFRVEALPLG